MKPIPMSRPELMAVLDDIRESVAAGDSFEGSIEYLIPVPGPCWWCHGTGRASVVLGGPCQVCDGSGRAKLTEEEEDADFLVQASYRVGNRMGQGGVRLVGNLDDERSDPPMKGP